MNKNNRKNKRIYKRILALMLCCFCLLATVPISAFALETGKTQITEERISEQQSESTSESLLSLSSETSELQTETDTQQSTSDEIIEPIIENETDTEVETEVASETGTEANTETETETDAADSETEAGSETEINAEIETEANTETETEADAAGSETETGSEAEVNAATGSEADSETESEAGEATETEPSYLEQLDTYYNQAVEAGPDADDAVYAEIYNGTMAVYAAAGSPSAEADPEIYNAVGMVVSTLQGYGYDPYAVAELPGPDDQGGGTNTATSGNLRHIEIEIASSVTYYIDGVKYTDPLTISMSDTYLVRSYTLDADKNKVYTDLNFTGTFSITGSSENGTTYYIQIPNGTTLPTGTSTNPVYYEITIYTTHTITVEGVEVTLPVELKTSSYYWSADNYCPGVHMNESESSWEDGYYVGHGMDIPISGKAVGSAITTGKLAILKTVEGEENSSAVFRFYLKNEDGKYLTFSNNAYTGTSETLTSDCYVTVTAGTSLTLTGIPVGTYKITEVQKDGYIITDAEGNESDNYTKDYVVEEKTDDDVPVVSFTNKKLSNEAGISIAKTATGLSAYSNINVSIYSVGTDGNKTGSALWTGTLTPNGDRLYLPIQLEPGTYIIEESGHTVDGYNCTTTLSGGETVDGLKFTVEAGKRYDLTVNNAYELPKLCNITISKTVSGNMGDQSKAFAFTAILSGDYTFEGVTYSINDGEDQDAGDKVTCTFTLKHGQSITFKDLPIGAEFTVTETSYSEAGYVTKVGDEVTNTKTVTLAETNGSIAFVNTKDATIDTGILLDTLPYILILGVVAVGAVLLIKKRINRDDD